MNKFLFIAFLFLIPSLITAQDLKFFGEAAPGRIIIGEGPGIKEAFLNDKPLMVDAEGRFVAGFDRDAAGSQIIKVFYNSGKSETKTFNLPERKYHIEKLNIADRYVTPPKRELKRIERESQQMKQARGKVGIIDSAFYFSGFLSPVKNGRQTGIFGSQRILNGTPKTPHNGIDLAAPKGTPVLAASDGIVQIAGKNFYYNGNFVLLDHGQGLTSVYLHMNRLLVKTGDFVKKGQQIGEVGSTGRSTGPHLHWGVQWYDKRIDPESLLELSLPSE